MEDTEESEHPVWLSVGVIILVNAAVFLYGWHERMSLVALMLLYIVHSMFVGVRFALRVVLLKPGRLVSRETKKDRLGRLADYAGGNSLYVAFAFAAMVKVDAVDFATPADYAWCALGFAISEGYTLWRQLVDDAARHNNPYDIDLDARRLFAMQLAIVFTLLKVGPAFDTRAWLVLGVLKTVLDVGACLIDRFDLD